MCKINFLKFLRFGVLIFQRNFCLANKLELITEKLTRYCVIFKLKQKSGVSGVSLFRFPHRGNELVENEWKSAAGFPSSYNSNNSECICSGHFKPDEIVKSEDASKMFPVNSSIYPTINIFKNHVVIC